MSISVSYQLEELWKLRDTALRNEQNTGIPQRTSKEYIKAQQKIDNYFLPAQKKTIRNKPKKSFNPNEW